MCAFAPLYLYIERHFHLCKLNIFTVSNLSSSLLLISDMATATVSQFVSKSCHLGSESKANLALKSHAVSLINHNGLRSMNRLNALTMKGKGRTRLNNRSTTAGTIVCQDQGMNLVFVGAEVGPWSKTGGLGDVLGGLPPAMAVRKSAANGFHFDYAHFVLFVPWKLEP